MSGKEEGSRRGLSPGQKTELTSLVSYHDGSVVSRTLVEVRAGTVTLFAFDDGQGLNEHRTPYNALLHLLEGEALVAISGEESRVAAEEVILLPAGKPHAVRAPQRFKMLLTMIRSGRSA